jgi:hypothetical protein
MAEQCVFRYAPVQAALEGIDVIDAFANKDTAKTRAKSERSALVGLISTRGCSTV